MKTYKEPKLCFITIDPLDIVTTSAKIVNGEGVVEEIPFTDVFK